MFKITLAQINPTIGDFDTNVALMREAARKARIDGAQMVVFPELSLCGYYPADLLEDPAFMHRLNDGFDNLLLASRETPSLYWVVGLPERNYGKGKPLNNSLFVVCNGEVVLTYAKQLLPTYNIFDERRHFEPGPDVAKVLNVHGTRVGFLVCEDGWNDEGADYAVNPFVRMADAAPDLVVSINASPSNIGKREQRMKVFTEACRGHNLALVYVNQVGGHDQLVYDGASFAVAPDGTLAFESKRFVEDVQTLSFDTVNRTFSARDGSALPAVDAAGLSTYEFYRQQIVLGLKDYARRCGFKKAVVGSSGGIDSALTLALAVEALGAENVTGITMPSSYSSAGSVTDSELLCNNLGVKLLTHPIGELVHLYKARYFDATEEDLRGVSAENLQARIRGTILMEYSNMTGALLLTTGNKSEVSVGYCTLYGDTNGGIGLIGDLYKTEVFALSRHINETAGREIIPLSVITKPPSAELAPDQKDTDSLPPYELLDEVLKTLIEGNRLAAWEQESSDKVMNELYATEEGKALVARIRSMIARNEYKRRQSPPILRVRARAFGSGRQVPIAAKHY